VATLWGLKASVADLQQQVRQLPGGTGVAAVGESPLPLVTGGGAWTEWGVRAVGGAASSEPLNATPYSVTPDYFEVAGIAFQEGSTWPDTLVATSPGSRPIVIDEIAARRLFGRGPAIGRQVHAHDRYGSLDEVFTVVGVVKYVFMFGPEWGDRLSVYYPMDSTRRRLSGLLVRTSLPPAALVRSVDGALRPLSNPPDVRIVEDTFRRLTAPRRFNAAVMSLFALVALLIGTAGIYAVMSSVVAQRTREIGIRMALGATAAGIHRTVLVRTGSHLVLGAALGFPIAWWVSRGFGSLLFDVRPGDPSTYGVVAATLIFVGLLAAWVPARRAARVDPIVSLRDA
jgi:ABC-type antimicrobial peptide transport system permease subunit